MEFTDAFYILNEEELKVSHLEGLHKMTIKMLANQGMFPEVRINLERFKPEYFADIIKELVKISAENEHHEMTAYLLNYQYKHKLFSKTELRL